MSEYEWLLMAAGLLTLGLAVGNFLVACVALLVEAKAIKEGIGRAKR